MEKQAKQKLEEENKRIEKTIGKIKKRVAVFSGKGGVGKTTVAINLASTLKSQFNKVGILDADITGPNILKMLGINESTVVLDSKIVPFEKYEMKVISIASMIKKGQPVIWRGPMRSKIISQFLADVEWGELDYLIADLPPGTGDEILTIAQQMKPEIAIIVTTPQDVSIIDAERAINMAKQLEIPFIGIVENMSGFLCPHCSKVLNVFGEGGGNKLALENDIPFLGSIPITIDTRKSGDYGIPIVLEKPDEEITESFKAIVSMIEFEHEEKIVEVT
jgi:ATP-binding protein involved in chromosome partitioning